MKEEAPSGWRVSRLSELCADDAPIMYGILQPGPEISNGVPYVRPTEIDDDGIRLDEIKRTSPEIAAQYRRATLKPGDLLITIVGTLGKIAVVPPELDGANITQSSARIRLNGSRADSRFIRQVLRGPVAIKQYDRARLGTRHRVLKISSVTAMTFIPTESKPIPDDYEPPAEHYVRKGDLLFSRANTSDLVGAVALVDHTPDNLLLPDKLWRFVWSHPRRVDPVFVWSLFQSPAMRFEIGRRATGTSGSMKNISQEKLLRIRTTVPPLDLQREFAARVAAVERLKAAQRAALAELDALFASLQHRAFRGEL